MWESIYTPYPDERSSSVVPLVNAITELFVADAINLKPSFNFKAETTKHKTQAEALEYVWKYDWRKAKRDQELVKNEYVTAIFGTSIIYTGFETLTREQQDFVVNDDLTYGFKTKEITDNNIILKNFDIRNFWADDSVSDNFDEAIDCIAIEYIPFDKFKNLKNNPLYKNIDTLKPRTYDLDYKTYIVQEESTKQGDFIKIMHYWNIERDIYLEIANDSVIIREHPVISTRNGRKALPFTVRPF